MSNEFSVRLRHDTTDLYTFEAAPFVSPKVAQEQDDTGAVVAVVRTWVLSGFVYGKSTTLPEAYATLRAVVEATGSTQVNRVELLRGASVLESISTADGFDFVKITDFSVAPGKGQWRSRLAISLTVTGRKPLETSGGSIPPGVAALTLEEDWSYSPEGLLTRTLSGTVETTSSATDTATEIARTLGLELPSRFFAYETNGPEGVNVTSLDRLDRKASFRSSIRESGRELPANVTSDFEVATTTLEREGESVTTISVTARGTGAVEAVKARAPAGAVTLKSLTIAPWGLGATAVYETRKAQTRDPVIVRQRSFTLTGGSRPVRFTPRTGGREPAEHLGCFQPFELVEQVAVENVGVDGATMYFPKPVPGLREDASARVPVGPSLVERGAKPSADRYAASLRRVYRGARAADAYSAILDAIKSSFDEPAAGLYANDPRPTET